MAGTGTPDIDIMEVGIKTGEKRELNCEIFLKTWLLSLISSVPQSSPKSPKTRKLTGVSNTTQIMDIHSKVKYNACYYRALEGSNPPAHESLHEAQGWVNWQLEKVLARL